MVANLLKSVMKTQYSGLYWTTKDGTKMRIEYMTPRHRANVINMAVQSTIRANTDKACGLDMFVGGDSMGADAAFGMQEDLLDFVSRPDKVRKWILQISPVHREMAKLNGEFV
jgi:hypothetical protein